MSAKTIALVSFVAAGIAARIAAGSKFYKSAIAYHTAKKTVFPRPRNDAMRLSLSMDDVTAVFKLHDGGIGEKARLNGNLCTLPAGDKRGQAMFDIYKITSQKASQAAKPTVKPEVKKAIAKPTEAKPVTASKAKAPSKAKAKPVTVTA